MSKRRCSDCGAEWYSTLDLPCSCKYDKALEALQTWAGMASELLKALGKGDTTTVVELDKAIANFKRKRDE